MLDMMRYLKSCKKFCAQLKEAGGFTLHKAKVGGLNRPLFPIKCSWYNIDDIKREVKGSACIYIRPVQKDLNTRKVKVWIKQNILTVWS